MKAISWIVILTGLALATGCTTSPPSVTGTEGIDVNSGNLQTVATDTAVAGLVDSDNDSIEDSIDVCPDTSTRVMVDESGCEFTMGVIEGLKFGINELALSNEAAEVLDKYIAVLVRYPEVTVAVEGHTDNRGPAADNLELSKERVLSVVRYMVTNGISPDRIQPFGYGESRPRAANATIEGRELNRRIEIRVLSGLS